MDIDEMEITVYRGYLLLVFEVLEINPRVLHMLGKHSYHGGAAYSWEDLGSGQSFEDRSRAVYVCVYTVRNWHLWVLDITSQPLELLIILEYV